MDKNTLDVNRIISSIKTCKWHKRGKWHQSVIIHELGGEGEETSRQKKIGYPFKNTRQLWYKDEYFDLEKEWDQVRKIVQRGYSKDKNYLFRYAYHCLKTGEELIKFSRRYRKISFRALKNQKLGQLYFDLIDECKNFMPFMFSLHIFDDFLSDKFDKLLQDYIKARHLSKEVFFDYQTVLTLPYKKIFVLKEKIDLMKIALKVKNGKTLEDFGIKKEVREHTKEFRWINMGLLEKGPFEEKYFEKRIKELSKQDIGLEYRQLLDEEAELKEKQEKLMEKIKSAKELYFISKTIQKFGFLRSFRVDALFIAYGNGWELVEEIAKRLHLKNVLDIKYLDSKETRQALDNRLDYKRLITERKKNLLSVMIGKERYELVGRDADRVASNIKFPKEDLEGGVKGSVAYPGRITGICKVLHKLEDMQKIKKGDILVISMTDPGFIPAMERASAFVTDQGGILCHAAIISREMKKPCIIGTKVATKVFKDGDLVEVNADRGIVKIVKKS